MKKFFKKRSKKKGPVRSNKVEHDGINFASGLEVYMYKALKEAGYEFDVLDLHQVPHRYWSKKKNRVEAIKDLVKKSGKSPEEIKYSDFRGSRLKGLLVAHYNDRYKKALQEADLLSKTPGVQHGT